jgi:AhpD family alkylhydroperoxidase
LGELRSINDHRSGGRQLPVAAEVDQRVGRWFRRTARRKVMHKDWKARNETLLQALATYRQAAPEVTRAFSGLAQAATKPGVLDVKTKELIALAIGIAGRCDGCIGFHTAAAVKHGASRDEVLETIGVAIYMGGGPSYVYGGQALEAYDQLSKT